MKQKQKPLSFSLHPDNIAYIEAAVLKQKEGNHRYSRSMYLDDLITHLRTKEKPVKKIKMPVVKDDTPENLNVLAWFNWLEFRKVAKFKKYKTNAQMNKLSKMGTKEEQALIIQQSIDNEYQGLFALKGNSNGQNTGNAKGASQKKSAYERAREANSEYRQPDECQVAVGADGRHLGGAVDEGTGRATLEHVDSPTFIDYE